MAIDETPCGECGAHTPEAGAFRAAKRILDEEVPSDELEGATFLGVPMAEFPPLYLMKIVVMSYRQRKWMGTLK